MANERSVRNNRMLVTNIEAWLVYKALAVMRIEKLVRDFVKLVKLYCSLIQFPTCYKLVPRGLKSVHFQLQLDIQTCPHKL